MTINLQDLYELNKNIKKQNTPDASSVELNIYIYIYIYKFYYHLTSTKVSWLRQISKNLPKRLEHTISIWHVFDITLTERYIYVCVSLRDLLPHTVHGSPGRHNFRGWRNINLLSVVMGKYCKLQKIIV